jgi:pimeloyl-ACP methyl ester carboxylesterase
MALYQHRTVYVGDIKTHFLEAGRGPDLVLLHGGEYGASAEITWRYNIDTLAQRFHILAPDIPGWGLTDKLYSFSDPAGLRIKHLQRFLETLGIGKAYFVGNSAGGGLVLRAAVRQPAPLQIVKMVTICGNASVFKTNSQADLENYTPSLENMKKMVALLYHEAKWQSDDNSASAMRVRLSPALGKPYRRRACAVRRTRRDRRPKSSSSSLGNWPSRC